MRIEVGSVNKVSRMALAAAATGYAYWMLGRGPGTADVLTAWVTPAHVAAGYGLTILAYAAFPHSRRADLTKVTILACTALEIARYLSGRSWEPANLAGAAAGAIAVMLPSFLERFRSLARADPRQPFSLVYPHDRRRRGPNTSAAKPDSASADGASVSA